MTRLTAITPDQFAGKTWNRCSSYAFAARLNVLPVTVAELASLVPALPMGFVQTADTFQLVAITALQQGVNHFVAPDGRWLGDYVPAALRGYPFQLVKSPDRQESILCFDESSGLLAEAGEAEAFFDVDGVPSQPIKDILNFLSQIECNQATTQAAVNALQGNGLIQPWPLNLRQDERTVSVQGLYRIDEAALNVLPNENFLALRMSGALPVAYAQLLSMNQLNKLQKAAQAQAQLKVQAASQGSTLAGLGVGLLDGETIRFH